MRTLPQHGETNQFVRGWRAVIRAAKAIVLVSASMSGKGQLESPRTAALHVSFWIQLRNRNWPARVSGYSQFLTLNACAKVPPGRFGGPGQSPRN